MATITPSTAIQVPSDTPISRCVALMNEHRIGSLLVCSNDEPGQLVGIFTERDLLRNAELIHTGGYWSFPVSSVMSRPVITVELKHIDQAGAVMMRHTFRHLPVVETLANGTHELCGIISIRDVLLAKLLPLDSRQASAHELPKPVIQLQIYSKDSQFEASISRILRKLCGGTEVTSSAVTSPGKTLQGLTIIEADGFEPHEIASIVRDRLGTVQTKAIFVFHQPGGLSKITLKALEELRSTGKVELFSKPLNLMRLSDALGRMRVGMP